MILKKINKAFGYIAGLLIFVAALVMFYDVISRYIFNAPSLYAPFIAAFLVLGAIFMGVSYSFQSGGQVYVEILIEKLPLLPQKIVFTCGYVLSLLFIGTLTKSCWDYAVKAWEGNWKAQGNLPIPTVILYGVMIGGLVLLLLTIVLKMIEIWSRKKTEEAK